MAELGAERMEELAPHATLRDAGMAAGIATDKLLALLGETGGGVPVNIALQVNVEALHQKYAELIASLPQPPAAKDLQSGEENLQK